MYNWVRRIVVVGLRKKQSIPQRVHQKRVNLVEVSDNADYAAHPVNVPRFTSTRRARARALKPVLEVQNAAGRPSPTAWPSDTPGVKLNCDTVRTCDPRHFQIIDDIFYGQVQTGNGRKGDRWFVCHSDHSRNRMTYQRRDERSVLEHQFAAFGARARFAAVCRLRAEGELHVSDLATSLGVTVSAMSKHIEILEEAELVSVRRVGRETRVSLDEEGLVSLMDFLDFLTKKPQLTHPTEI